MMTNTTFAKAQTNSSQTISRTLLLVLISSLFLLSGCGKSSSDGDVENEVDLPTDDTSAFNLYCRDIGLYLENCVLDDPDNPYARSPLTVESKFELDADAPSATARFYLWATALTKGVGAPGENQFYVALNLHRMWASSNSEVVRVQALRAYQSYLDNFFNSLTYFEIPEKSDDFFPFSLNEFTGELLFDPTNVANTFTSVRLFSPDPDLNKTMASQEVGVWGYFYDQDTGIFARG
jgi:hypothetical protein